ncbi:hypothetical protein QIS74_02024 [Colletotrichum tabaci]|uniref:Uncharacterized protein n=1 Tax=Colletotrichum tabaci TaxID=1209068 RepID=A0AAV9TTI6_9PEZI
MASCIPNRSRPDNRTKEDNTQPLFSLPPSYTARLVSSATSSRRHTKHLGAPNLSSEDIAHACTHHTLGVSLGCRILNSRRPPISIHLSQPPYSVFVIGSSEQ